MKRPSLLSKPECWLILLAAAGILIGTVAAYSDGRSRAVPAPAAVGLDEESGNTVLVFEATKRGVVMVLTSYSVPRRGVARRGNGSGFFIDAEGHLVTNNHVIEEASAITVQTFSGNVYRASVVGADRLTDLAVLSVEGIPRDEVYPLVLADYRTVRVGQKAIVLGSPLATGSSMGLDRSPTITTGVISAKDRSMPIESPTRPNVNDFTIENLIQTDAAVNPGNSGGPLLDSEGQVVGVVTAIIDSAAGIGFAIPSQVVGEVVPQLLKSGQVKRAFMGVVCLSLDVLSKDMDEESFARLELGVTKGALVTTVEEGGPAHTAGLRGSTRKVILAGQELDVGGDIIVNLDGVEVVGCNLSGEILKHRPGDKVTVGILRDGKKMSLEVTLGSR